MNTQSVTSSAIIRLSTFVLLTLLALSGCATMNEQECLEGDWHSSGFKDASKGRTDSRLISHTKACAKHGVAANKSLYIAGYQSGLEQYCTAENGTVQGNRNKDYRGICPADKEPEFLTQYIRGLLLAQQRLNRNFREVDNALRNARRNPRTTDEQSIRLVDRRIKNLSNKRDDLRIKRLDVNRKIRQWSSHPGTTNT